MHTNSLWGSLLAWIFKNVFKGPDMVSHHTYKELMFFKERLEADVAESGVESPLKEMG